MAGDTLVLTDEGDLPANRLCADHVNVWDGCGWREAQAVTSGLAPMVEAVLEDGRTLRCTVDQRVLVRWGNDSRLALAGGLSPGDELRSVTWKPGNRPKDGMVRVAFVRNAGRERVWNLTGPFGSLAVYNGILASGRGK